LKPWAIIEIMGNMETVGNCRKHGQYENHGLLWVMQKQQDK
jgi:hypothetical protein